MSRYPFLVVSLCGLSAPACDLAMPTLPEPTTSAAPEPITPSATPTYASGLVAWEDVTSDCLDNAWDDAEYVTVRLDEDTITLWFETMPELTGPLSRAPGRSGTTYVAEVQGAMTFAGETGATVSCDVQGTSSLTDGELRGTMTERLSSVGDVNCTSSGSFRLTLLDTW